MKKFLEKIDKLPSIVSYVLILAVLAALVYSFPRFSFLLGSVFHYGLLIFFALGIVVSIVYNIFLNNDK